MTYRTLPCGEAAQKSEPLANIKFTYAYVDSITISLWKRRGIRTCMEQNKSLSNYPFPKEMTAGGWRIMPHCLEATFVEFFSFRVLIAQKKYLRFFCTNFPPGLSELRHEVRRLETQV